MIHRLFLPCRFKLNGRSVGGIPNKSHHADQNPESVEKIVSSALVCEFSSFFPDTPTLNEGQQEYNYDAKGSVVRLKLKLALAKRWGWIELQNDLQAPLWTVRQHNSCDSTTLNWPMAASASWWIIATNNRSKNSSNRGVSRDMGSRWILPPSIHCTTSVSNRWQLSLNTTKNQNVWLTCLTVSGRMSSLTLSGFHSSWKSSWNTKWFSVP